MDDSAPPSPDDQGAPGAGALDALGREPFVALTTYRRTGEGVATPVWAVPDPDVAGRLWVTTPGGSGSSAWPTPLG